MIGHLDEAEAFRVSRTPMGSGERALLIATSILRHLRSPATAPAAEALECDGADCSTCEAEREVECRPPPTATLRARLKLPQPTDDELLFVFGCALARSTKEFDPTEARSEEDLRQSFAGIDPSERAVLLGALQAVRAALIEEAHDG